MISRTRMLGIVTLSASLAVTSVLGQSSKEREALRDIGEGFVLYTVAQGNDEGDIMRNDLDGKGSSEPTTVAYGRDATLTEDGKAMFWVHDNDIYYAANVDGQGARKINTSSFPQTIDYLRAEAAGEHRVIFSVGRNYVYTMDKDGNQTRVVSESGSSYLSYLDLYGDWVIWRWDSHVYVDRYTGSPLSSGSGNRLVTYRCAGTFSPSGLRCAVNTNGHDGVNYYRRGSLESGSWSSDGTGAWPFKLHKYNWSNSENWIAARAQDCNSNTCGIWAIHTTTGKLIRMTFSGEEHVDPNLFVVSAATSTVKPRALGAPLKVHRGVASPDLFDLRGARVRRGHRLLTAMPLVDPSAATLIAGGE